MNTACNAKDARGMGTAIPSGATFVRMGRSGDAETENDQGNLLACAIAEYEEQG